jgi:hypothetical protein
MPKFFHHRDLSFIKTIGEEVIDSVVEQFVTLFKVSVGESKTNLYGESLGKVYHAPTNLYCIVNREDPTFTYEGFGPDKEQPVTFSFKRERLRPYGGGTYQELPYLRDVNGVKVPVDAIQNTQYGYPQIGDIIKFNDRYYELATVRENRLAGGSPKIWNEETNSWDDSRVEIVATGMMVRKSQVQIENRIL